MLKEGFFTSANPYTRKDRFDIPSDSSNAINVEADMLPAPAIQPAKNVREEPDQGGKLGSRPPNNYQFLKGSTCRRWLAVNYNRAIDDRVFK